MLSYWKVSVLMHELSIYMYIRGLHRPICRLSRSVHPLCAQHTHTCIYSWFAQANLRIVQIRTSLLLACWCVYSDKQYLSPQVVVVTKCVYMSFYQFYSDIIVPCCCHGNFAHVQEPKVSEEVRARWTDKRLYLAKIVKISSEGKLTDDLLALDVCVCLVSVLKSSCGR